MSPGKGIDTTFGFVSTLPRGPHDLDSEEVAESQRLRLMAALVELMAERSWDGLKIGDMVTRAGVSRSAFYKLFNSKHECLLDSYDHYSERLIADSASGLDPGLAWTDLLAGALEAYLESIQGHLPSARTFMVEFESAGPAAREHRDKGARAFAEFIRESHRIARSQEPQIADLPDRLFLGISFGIRGMIRYELEKNPDPDLVALCPEITDWIVATFRGAL